jgi:hypothetical protein
MVLLRPYGRTVKTNKGGRQMALVRGFKKLFRRRGISVWAVEYSAAGM